jgi:hypothetical protein
MNNQQINITTEIKFYPGGRTLTIRGRYPCTHTFEASSDLSDDLRLKLGDGFAMECLMTTLAKALCQSPCPDCGMALNPFFQIIFKDTMSGVETVIPPIQKEEVKGYVC